MSFLQPNFLYGLIALVIPIIIHLFDFRRTKKVYFSNTRLLNQVKESTRSFYNLKHLLIMFSRMLFIAALVIAFAQPFIAPEGANGLRATRVGIFVDNSYSMSNRVGQDESGLSMARETAIELINLYPAGTEFMVQSAFEESSVNLYLSKQAAIDKISQLELIANASSLQTVLDRFNNTAADGPTDIILLSDFQKAIHFKEDLQLDSQLRYIVAPLRFAAYRNVAIDSAYISNPFELDKSKTTLTVRLRNYAKQEQTDLPVKLFLGDRQLSVSTIDLPASSTATIDFTVGQAGATEAGAVVVEDFPLSFDNTLYFTLQSINKVNITQIMGPDAGDFISAVFGNQALFNLNNMPEANINYANLETADIIIINEVPALDPSLAQRLRSLNERGTGVLIIPSISPDIASYRAIIPQVGASQFTGRMALVAPDFARPFYQNILERRDDNLQMPQANQVWRWGGDRNALLKFIDGQPFLSEVENRLYILAAPLKDSYSDFQDNALFVPIMYRLAANSQQNIVPLYYRIDRNEISLKYEELEANSVIRLKNEQIEFLPDQRLTGNSLDMMLPRGKIPAGHYEVMANEKKLKAIALNYRTEESDVAVASQSEITENFTGYDFNLISGADAAEIVANFSADYEGIALWRYFLGLALLFLLVEALLIRLL